MINNNSSALRKFCIMCTIIIVHLCSVKLTLFMTDNESRKSRVLTSTIEPASRECLNLYMRYYYYFGRPLF